MSNPNKDLWAKGDFTRIAATMRESGEALVESLGVTEGMDVLDVGSGDGTTAVPSAQRGANVVAVDITEQLVAVGAMCAPRPFDVAKELVRVARPGGRVVMGNWIPGDPTLVAQILRISSAYSPPPPEGFVSPMTWGVESEVVERFTAAAVPETAISFERATYVFNSPETPSEFLANFRRYYAPTMNAYAAAAADGREDELHAELDSLFNEQNTSSDGMSIPATFLKVTVAV